MMMLALLEIPKLIFKINKGVSLHYMALVWPSTFVTLLDATSEFWAKNLDLSNVVNLSAR